MSPPSSGSGNQQQQPVWMSFVPMILLIVVFYFILIRPQQRRARQQTELLKNLKSGDKVVTSSGIVGQVITVKDKTVSLRSADAKMEVTKASVTEILESSSSTDS
jgi:preprotein translocase subunit YajC